MYMVDDKMIETEEKMQIPPVDRIESLKHRSKGGLVGTHYVEKIDPVQGTVKQVVVQPQPEIPNK